MLPSFASPPARAVACAVLTLTVAAPLHAQDTGACGQTAALTQSLSAALSPGFEPVRTFLPLRRNEPRYLEFALDVPQDVTIATDSPAADPAIALYDQTGQVVAWDDDSGGNLQGYVAQTLGAGRYCVQVRPIGGEPVDFVEIVLVLESGITPPPGQIVPCSDPATVRELASGLAAPVSPTTLEDETGESGSAEYRLTLAEPLALGLQASSGVFDTVIDVTDFAGTVIASNDDFSGTDSRIDQTFPAGEYCVTVRSFDGAGGAFSLALSEADPAALPVAPCSDPARTASLAAGFGPGAAPVLLQSQSVGAMQEASFSLNVAEPVGVRLDSRSDRIDTVLKLYDSTGTVLTENDDGPEGTNSRIDTTLAPGDYCVTVTDFDGSDGTFDLSLAMAGTDPALPAPAPVDPSAATGVEDMGVLGTEVKSYTVNDVETLWTSFTVESAGDFEVRGISVSSDFSLDLFDAEGAPLQSAGRSPAMTESVIPVTLEPGVYLAALTNHGATGTILRQVTVTRK